LRISMICYPGAGLQTRNVPMFRISFFDVFTNSHWKNTDAPSTSCYDPERRHLRITPSTLQGYCFKPFDPILSLTIDSVSFAFFDSHPPQHSLRNLIPNIQKLHILYPTARPGSLFRFLLAFTALQEVTIHAPRWIGASDDNDDVDCATLSCTTLRISEFDDLSNSFLSLLGSKSSGYEKVAVIKCNFRNTVPLQTLISRAGKTIRRLQIAVSLHGEFNLYILIDKLAILTRITSSGPIANAPVLSLVACETLEQVFVTVAGANTSFLPIASALDSITSIRFQKLILELRTTARREPDGVQVELVDRLAQLDGPLSQIARAASEKNRDVSLMLLAQDPEFLAQGFTHFGSLGHVWAGEEVGDGEYHWTVAVPKNVRRRHIRILTKLFRQKTLD